MRRFITDELLAWKDQKRRKPLIIRGARQVGKTWAVRDFAQHHVEGALHVVDLEQHPGWRRIFDDDLVPARLLAELEIQLNARIAPGRDLLFLDEVQSCPRAVMALRYFYEQRPDLHVIAAGSLLEFVMRDIAFPVGRVQFLNMSPMSFPEFLLANKKELAAEIALAEPKNQPETAHALLLDELRRYLFIGGMPESVHAYVEGGSLHEAFAVQAELVNTYREDFAKYAPHSDKTCLNTVFAAVARSVGQQIKYSRLAEGYANPTIKKAFDLLDLARVVRRVPAVKSARLPLGATASPRKFKALMVDIGLMQHLCGMPVDIEFAKSDLLDIYEGAMAEQLVGQELIAAGQEQLHYWARDARGSEAEVDFLLVADGRVQPVEVKSGAAGRLKSLHAYLGAHPNCPNGWVLSCAPYSELPEQRLKFLPLYYAYALGRRA